MNQKEFNVIKYRKSNSTLIYRVRLSDNLVYGETKLGKILASNLYEASQHLEHRLDAEASGLYSTSGRIE